MKFLNKVAITGVFLGLFLSAGIVLVRADSEEIETQRIEFKERVIRQTEELRKQQEKLRERAQETKEELRETIKFSDEEIKERAKLHQEKFEAERQKIREGAQKRKEEYEARAKALKERSKEEIESRKQEFREKLAQIREERHRRLATKLSEKMNRVNQHMSNAALKYLDALELVLSKIEARTEIARERSGADLTQVKLAITSARRRIEEARSAVLAQKSKEYVINIESQETLGQNIRNAMQELKNDHQQLRKNVLRPLRDLVHDVMHTLRTAVERKGKDAAESLEEEFKENEVEEEQ